VYLSFFVSGEYHLDQTRTPFSSAVWKRMEKPPKMISKTIQQAGYDPGAPIYRRPKDTDRPPTPRSLLVVALESPSISSQGPPLESESPAHTPKSTRKLTQLDYSKVWLTSTSSAAVLLCTVRTKMTRNDPKLSTLPETTSNCLNDTPKPPQTVSSLSRNHPKLSHLYPTDRNNRTHRHFLSLLNNFLVFLSFQKAQL